MSRTSACLQTADECIMARYEARQRMARVALEDLQQSPELEFAVKTARTASTLHFIGAVIEGLPGFDLMLY